MEADVVDSGLRDWSLRNSYGRIIRNPDEETLQAVVQTLTGGDHVVISERTEAGGESPQTYAQLWLRPDRIYQLEYRDGMPSRHSRAMTVSMEKAAGFLIRWCAQTPDYVEGFQWEEISGWFAVEE